MASQECTAFYISPKGMDYTSCQCVLPSGTIAHPVTDSLQQVSEPAQSPCGDNTKPKVSQQRSEDCIPLQLPYAPTERHSTCLSRSLYRDSIGTDVHIILLLDVEASTTLKRSH